MTKAEMARTAAFAALSIAIGEALDVLETTSVVTAASSVGGTGSNSLTDTLNESWNTTEANPGQAMTEGLADSGKAALSWALNALALGLGTSAGAYIGSAALDDIPLARKWNTKTSTAKKDCIGITAKIRCERCKESFSTVLGVTGRRIHMVCIERVPHVFISILTLVAITAADLQCNKCQFQQLKDYKSDCRKEKESAISSLHLGVFCDGCCSGIMGSRYACVDCADFDLCSGSFSHLLCPSASTASSLAHIQAT
ncbi:hypothetical protein CBS101457_005022 [Exobasidium rhododendri]|nr:hypothetical protein CBS101457_005022 [Exobasidium rhododendri]